MILITAGDPGGIGPEVIIKALEKIDGDFWIIGSRRAFEYMEERLSLFKWREYRFLDPEPGADIQIGKPHGRLSFLYFQKALEILKTEGKFALVTGPVSKHAWMAAGQNFLGHTDFFEKEHGKAVMAFWSRGMKVALYTHHLPLKEALKKINPEGLREFLTLLLPYLEHFFPGDEILVSSVNPHAGEGGEMGREEVDIIQPIARDFGLEGPLPSDTVFLRAEMEGKWVLAFFHDIGLAPFKLLHFEDGAEITFGLPWPRTSPCHGTGFDIAGRGEASEGSMLTAIKLAQRMLKGL